MEHTQRVYRKGDCSYCKEHKFIAAHGLCRACYQRNKKNGQLEKIKVKHICTIDGCGEFVESKNLCKMHYSRLNRHGDPLHNNRPIDWGSREEHPLYRLWTSMRRSSFKGVLSDFWKSDFWLFVSEVGDRPSKDHFLRLIDDQGIYENGNVEWEVALISKHEFESSVEYRSRYLRVSRSESKDRFKGYDLKKGFGITLVDYNKMNADQNGVCAICGNKETMVNPRHLHGKPQNLSVDHCHETGKIRGLLCSSCNVGLGYFKDNVALIEKAMNYLLKHKEN